MTEVNYDYTHLTDDEKLNGIGATKIPKRIRTSGYVSDFAESVAQLAELLIQALMNKGLDPDEALEWARKLQESVSKSEFDSWVATLLDGGPSLFFETKAALVAKHPNGAPGVALVRETDPAKIYVWNGSAWEDFGDYQGIEIKDNSVTTTKIANGAVTPTKIMGYIQPKNLLTIQGLKSEVGLLLPTGKVDSNAKTYKTFEPINVNPIARHLTFTSKSNGVINFYNNETLLQYKLVSSEYKTGDSYKMTIAIPSGTNNFRASVKVNASWSQIEYGAVATPYEPEGYYSIEHLRLSEGSVMGNQIADNTINPKSLKGYSSKNLLDDPNVTYTTGLLLDDGSVDGNAIKYKTTNYQNISSGQTHMTFTSISNGVINFYNNESLIQYKLVSSEYATGNSYKMTIEIPSGATRYRVSTDVNASWAQVEYGSVATPYGKYQLKGLDIDLEEVIRTKEIKPFNHDAEMVMFTAYGQSWALGYDEDAYTTEQIYDNLMFDTGISNEPLEDEKVPTSLVPLIEENGVHIWSAHNNYPQKIGETPVAGQTNMVKQLLEQENNVTTNDVSYQLIGNAPGVGSASIDDLSKGTKWYSRLITQVQQAYDLAQYQGRTFKMLAFSWTQGGGGEKLETLRADIEADVKAITGQAEPVICITWQNFPTLSTQAKSRYNEFVAISDTYEHMYTASPSYHLKNLSKENLHFDKISTIELGAHYGRVFKRVINDEKDWQPLRPTKITTQGRIALLEFNAKTPLVFDTEKITKAEHYGFRIQNALGENQEVTQVTISSPTTIRIIKSTNFNDTDRIIYGNTGNGWGGTDGNRGNLRDSDPEVYKYKDLEIPLHNWCVVFDLTVNELK